MPDHVPHRLTLPVGKLPAEILGRQLRALTLPPEVRVGPGVGEDACVIDVPAGSLVAAADPITLTGASVGRYAVTVNANDIAVMGVRPRWFLATVLLPPGTTESDVDALFADMRIALSDVGAVLVGGHTEITSAVTQPIVAGQMLGLASLGAYVTTGGAEPGDAVVQVGVAPVEGAAVLAETFGDRVPPPIRQAAAIAVDDPGISVVDAALLAAELGATAMHDPTEGGLAGGLHELAAASGVQLSIDGAAVQWFEPGAAMCSALGADPWATLASGCVIATFPNDAVERVLATLGTRFVAVRIGIVGVGAGVLLDGAPLAWPERDEVARLLDS